MRKLLQRLWDIAADFANFMGGLGTRLVWLPKLHFSPGAEHVRTDPGPALFVLNHSWWMDAPMLCLLCRRRRISVVAAGEMFTGVRSLAMRSLRCIPVDRAAGADLSFFHEALRRLRARLAREQHIPAYHVFTDATLHDMCRREPRSEAEFLQVSGVGEAKLARYGEDFIELIRSMG